MSSHTYIHTYNLAIAGAYGKVVRDWAKDGLTEGQIDLFEKYAEIIPTYELPSHHYKTTGCKRTGCIFCGFGITQDKDRFIRLFEQEPKLCDYVMRGGEFFYSIFDRNGSEIKLRHCTHKQISKWSVDNFKNENFKIESVWQPSKDGLGYWFVLEWLNANGNLGIGIPNREHYYKNYYSKQMDEYLPK